MKECAQCGAPCDGAATPLQATWTCSFCQAVNANEEYVRSYIEKIDFTKANNMLKVGINHFKAKRYLKANETLSEMVLEDSNSPEGWLYLALSDAYSLDVKSVTAKTLSEKYQAVKSFLSNAKENNCNPDLYAASEGSLDNYLGKIAEQSMCRYQDLGEKAYFAYASTSKESAVYQRDKELTSLAEIAEVLFSNKPKGVYILGECLVPILQASLSSNHTCRPLENVATRGKAELERIKDSHPKYYTELCERIYGKKNKKFLLIAISLLVIIILIVSMVR